MQWLKRLPSFSGLFMSVTSLVANLGMMPPSLTVRLLEHDFSRFGIPSV
jgi:hypothetical protein